MPPLTEPQPQPAGTGVPIGTIVGATLGGIAILVLVLVAGVWLYKRRAAGPRPSLRRKNSDPEADRLLSSPPPSPFPPPPPPPKIQVNGPEGMNELVAASPRPAPLGTPNADVPPASASASPADADANIPTADADAAATRETSTWRHDNWPTVPLVSRARSAASSMRANLSNATCEGPNGSRSPTTAFPSLVLTSTALSPIATQSPDTSPPTPSNPNSTPTSVLPRRPRPDTSVYWRHPQNYSIPLVNRSESLSSSLRANPSTSSRASSSSSSPDSRPASPELGRLEAVAEDEDADADAVSVSVASLPGVPGRGSGAASGMVGGNSTAEVSGPAGPAGSTESVPPVPPEKRPVLEAQPPSSPPVLVNSSRAGAQVQVPEPRRPFSILLPPSQAAMPFPLPAPAPRKVTFDLYPRVVA